MIELRYTIRNPYQLFRSFAEFVVHVALGGNLLHVSNAIAHLESHAETNPEFICHPHRPTS